MDEAVAPCSPAAASPATACPACASSAAGHPRIHPYDQIAWRPDRQHRQREGRQRFEQRDVEVPAFWSQLATNVVVSKYFRGHLGSPERETSVRQLIDRVVDTIAAWAETQHYFASDEDLRAFQAELTTCSSTRR